MENAKKVGRPAKHGVAMSDAQRMAEYRKRLRFRAEKALEEPSKATDQDLAACLHHTFTRCHPHPDTQTYLIEKYLDELCKRYKIRP